MKRKLLSLFLCAATVAGSAAMLASCAEGENKNTTASGDKIDVPADERFCEKIPDDLNFANMGLSEEELILTVAYVEGTNGEFTRRSLQADELDESDVDVATMARDTRMKDQLGLELYIDQVDTSITGMESAIGSVLQAGSPDYDILAGYQYFGIGMAKKGYLLNLADLTSYEADYIDLEAPYWGKAFNDNMSYKGAYYWITGDLALRYIGGMYCTFVNSTLYTDLLEADYGSIYTIAKDGKWTLDLMTEMAAKCYQDNGTTPGEVDAEDTFGFGWEPTDMIDGIAMGAGVQFSYKDPTTGDITITFNNDHTIEISEKIAALAGDKAFAYQYADGDSANVMTAFAGGTVAFTVNKLYQAEAYLADMVDDYYIIPAPKYDEAQLNYVTGIHDGCTIFGITYCSEKIPQSAAALEFLCAYSSKDVAPLYFEGALKGRYTRDPEAASMIDLIHSSVTTDFAVAWGGSIENISQSFRSGKALKKTDLKRKVDQWNTALETLTSELAQYVDGGATPEAGTEA